MYLQCCSVFLPLMLELRTCAIICLRSIYAILHHNAYCIIMLTWHCLCHNNNYTDIWHLCHSMLDSFIFLLGVTQKWEKVWESRNKLQSHTTIKSLCIFYLTVGRHSNYISEPWNKHSQPVRCIYIPVPVWGRRRPGTKAMVHWDAWSDLWTKYGIALGTTFWGGGRRERE